MTPAASRALLVLMLIAASLTGGRAQTAQNPPDLAAKLDTLIAESRAAMNAGRYAEGVTAAETVIRLSRETNDGTRLAHGTLMLGALRFFQGRTADALRLNLEGLALAEKAGSARLRLEALNSLGLSYRESGDYDRALDYFSQVLDTHRSNGDRAGQARTLRNIAVLLWQLGDVERATARIVEGTALARAAGSKPMEAVTLQTHGIILAAAGRPSEALPLQEQAWALATELKSEALLGEVAGNMGRTYSDLADFGKALERFNRAHAASLATGYKLLQASVETEMGETFRRLKNLDEAMTWLTRGFATFAAIEGTAPPYLMIGAQTWMARTLRDAGRTDEAMASYASAIDMLDRMRKAAVPAETTSASVISSRSEVFREAADLLMQQGRLADAFAVVERQRARTFLDIMVGSRIDLRQSIPEADRTHQTTLLDRATALQKRLWSTGLTEADRRRLDRELAAVDDEFEQLGGRIRSASGRFAAVHHPVIFTALDVQQRLLDDQTVFLQYMLGETRSYVWAVSRRGITSAELASRDVIGQQVRAYSLLLSKPVSRLTAQRSMREYVSAAERLYAVLLKPIEPALTGRRLIIAPDGILASVPFETLRSRRLGVVVERFDTSYVPSASALAAIAPTRESAPHRRDLLAAGDPVYAPPAVAVKPEAEEDVRTRYARLGVELTPLPSTRQEVNAISRLFSASRRTVLLGAEAREDRVKQQPLADFKYLHLAAHGLLDATNPARSGIILSQVAGSRDDGVLQVREVLTMDLNADLVTLSACQTGLGRVMDGEGVIGLTRAFFYAGARGVTVSLWNVNDAATTELMRTFYIGLRKGSPPDRALTDAKRALMRSPRAAWRHPYYWAPFVLAGGRSDVNAASPGRARRPPGGRPPSPGSPTRSN